MQVKGFHHINVLDHPSRSEGQSPEKKCFIHASIMKNIIIQHRQMGLEDLNVSFNSGAALTALHFDTKEGKQRREGKYMTRQLKYITF